MKNTFTLVEHAETYNGNYHLKIVYKEKSSTHNFPGKPNIREQGLSAGKTKQRTTCIAERVTSWHAYPFNYILLDLFGSKMLTILDS